MKDEDSYYELNYPTKPNMSALSIRLTFSNSSRSPVAQCTVVRFFSKNGYQLKNDLVAESIYSSDCNRHCTNPRGSRAERRNLSVEEFEKKWNE
jgi:hypothetical protein